LTSDARNRYPDRAVTASFQLEHAIRAYLPVPTREGLISDHAAHQARPLIEHLNRGTWTAQLLSAVGSGFSNVTGVATSHGAVSIVGSGIR